LAEILGYLKIFKSYREVVAGPSPGCNSRGGKNQRPKTRRGATFLKYSVGYMQQPVGQT